MMTGRIKRDEPQGARLPILGYIRIGEKQANTGYPKALEYFKATGPKGMPGKYDQYFKDAYGDKPNKIQIMFISDNWKDVCDEHYEIRDSAGRLLADGDGENWRCFNATKGLYDYGVNTTLEELERKYNAEPLNSPPIKDHKYDGKSSISLTLRFLLLKVPGVFGQWQFTTKGKASSIPAIRDTFDQVQQMAGTVVNIPFDLVVDKATSQKPGSKSTFSVVSLIPNLSKQNMDVLAEYVESGNKRIRGVLTDERIEQLKSNQLVLPENTQSTLMLESNNEVQSEPQVIQHTEIKQDLEFLSKEQIKELHALAKSIGIDSAEWADYMRLRGYPSSSFIPVIHLEQIKSDFTSRLAKTEVSIFRDTGEIKPFKTK